MINADEDFVYSLLAKLFKLSPTFALRSPLDHYTTLKLAPPAPAPAHTASSPSSPGFSLSSLRFPSLFHGRKDVKTSIKDSSAVESLRRVASISFSSGKGHRRRRCSSTSTLPPALLSAFARAPIAPAKLVVDSEPPVFPSAPAGTGAKGRRRWSSEVQPVEPISPSSREQQETLFDSPETRRSTTSSTSLPPSPLFPRRPSPLPRPQTYHAPSPPLPRSHKNSTTTPE
ncbi:hypothetical protein BCR35DRAFT_46818 [Leucosporidium creatinivorum]|uniref:Uncharacterized protein n=1 Tax=Leucosporidium creatinivorum TaxID=106004 RepID=A0A1Y2BZ65_9BASI|nr:hypothetical protein BCR35DRAFT_46818 [Leucosporidium creatinivorum]